MSGGPQYIASIYRYFLLPNRSRGSVHCVVLHISQRGDETKTWPFSVAWEFDTGLLFAVLKEKQLSTVLDSLVTLVADDTISGISFNF